MSPPQLPPIQTTDPYSWLRFAKLTDKHDVENLTKLNLKSPDPTHDAFPALRLAFDCAVTAFTSPPAIAALIASFVEPVTENQILSVVPEFVLYVTAWVQQNLCAFHVPPEEAPDTIAVGNIFIRKQDVQSLPAGPGPWSDCQKHYIVLMSWFILHEMAHALGSVLYERHVVTTHRTPTQATGFSGCCENHRALDKGNTCGGERGWYLEDILGGELRFSFERKCLVAVRPEQKKFFSVSNTEVDEYLSADPDRMKKVLPLSMVVELALTPEEKASLKGRSTGEQTRICKKKC